MQLQFLGAATTVTGSQFLLTTARARVLIDCGMFQGSPNESIRNRIPLAYDPHGLDAILLTHAHLDHCGLIPYVVAQGFSGPIYATAGTAELARLVLLDSGKLQEEFAKREARWEKRHPDKAVAEERQQEDALHTAMALAEAGEAGEDTTDALEATGGREAEDDEADAPLNRDASGASVPGAGSGTTAGSGTAVGSGTAGTSHGTAGTSHGAAGTTHGAAHSGHRPGSPDAAAAKAPAAPTATAPAPPTAAANAPAAASPGSRAAGTPDMPSRLVPDDRLMAADHWPELDPRGVQRGDVWIAPNPEVALRYQPPAVDVDFDQPIYGVDDAEKSLERFRPVRYDEEIDVAPGIRAVFVDAGHILGSAIIRVSVAETEQDEASPTRIVFSGDLGRCDTPIIRNPTVVTDADYVLMESTYGGREHEPQAEAIRILEETVRLVAENDGVLLVPSFAIGRTQEVVWELDRLLSAGKIPALPLYLDSPMASKASDVYRHHPDYYDQETRTLLEQQDSPLDYPNQVVTNDVRQSQAISRAKRPYMIVASNGMLTGGRVVAHLRELIDDPSAVLLFVGYQGKGTLGSHLQEGATTVRLDGQIRRVRCQVRSISGFSAHADESELLDWIGNFAHGKRPGEAGFPKKVFIVHGDPEAQRALAPKVQALGFTTEIPKWHEIVSLE